MNTTEIITRAIETAVSEATSSPVTIDENQIEECLDVQTNTKNIALGICAVGALAYLGYRITKSVMGKDNQANVVTGKLGNGGTSC